MEYVIAYKSVIALNLIVALNSIIVGSQVFPENVDVYLVKEHATPDAKTLVFVMKT